MLAGDEQLRIGEHAALPPVGRLQLQPPLLHPPRLALDLFADAIRDLQASCARQRLQPAPGALLKLRSVFRSTRTLKVFRERPVLFEIRVDGKRLGVWHTNLLSYAWSSHWSGKEIRSYWTTITSQACPPETRERRKRAKAGGYNPLRELRASRALAVHYKGWTPGWRGGEAAAG
jgi:hypothetical protein